MKIASEEIIPEQMIPQIDIDAILDLKEINQKFVNDLKKPFNICYTIEENTYNGNTSIQLMIKDIKPDDI